MGQIYALISAASEATTGRFAAVGKGAQGRVGCAATRVVRDLLVPALANIWVVVGDRPPAIRLVGETLARGLDGDAVHIH